jgi:hypothetical protein
MAVAFRIIGVLLIIIGVIGGSVIIINAYSNTHYVLNYALAQEIRSGQVGLAVAVTLSGFISGFTFLGFGEIIELLRRIANKDDAADEKDESEDDEL